MPIATIFKIVDCAAGLKVSNFARAKDNFLGYRYMVLRLNKTVSVAE